MNTATDSSVPVLLYTAAISVRWRDLDAFNHVNNSTYLTYLEEARVQWLQHLPGPWSSEHAMPVMAASTLNYRLPIEWPGEVHIELYCARMGNSSMTVAHRIVDAGDSSKLYCDGNVVMVWMDPSTGKSVALPPAIRNAASA
ncbi:acyl-CoA thioesterase [Dyella nitratireducens]|uniref:Thioesterase n=1 Tax=Dyella nitratireducens TaxID=1849580 RepID=A0ABQ1FLW2_9GAMM|nr:thioesterase family protein [Dyella nitratireducens]GGA18795.1 thioesterase [Dyella nitratireducens]GLQ44607.1 thioesterase [Dyella nitratireducens]